MIKSPQKQVMKMVDDFLWNDYDHEKKSTNAVAGLAAGLGRGHEIYTALFGDHLFYDLFLQGRGGHEPLGLKI